MGSTAAVRTEDGHRPHRQVPAMLKVGFIGFGGGSALIPVLEKELVTPHGGLTEKTFVQDTVIANITPGALPVKIAALSGIQLGGPVLATASAVAVALPGAAITVALLAFFAALGPDAIRIVEYASLGITAFILYLLAHYVAKVIRTSGHRRHVYVAIAIAAFLLTGADKTVGLVSEVAGVEQPFTVPELSALGLILAAIAGIALVSVIERIRFGRQRFEEHPEEPAGLKRTLAGVAVLAGLTVVSVLAAVLLGPAPENGSFLGLITFSTLSSFGGGEAYVGVADGFFVAPGLVESSVFYGQVVPVANALPGPILVKIASGLGYVVGFDLAGPALGAVLASAAFLASIGACSALALGVLAGYDKARHSLFVRNIASFILPVICGLLASTSVSMLHSNAAIGAEAGVPPVLIVGGTIAVAAAVPLVHRLARVPDVLIIVACGALSLALLAAL
ncbi:chromate transporter [Naasia sp. SYSU D00948]|uniref:chromate transporter n=1 Tax=Naasia sp. SYSU D00948 TaxID=2817379 RepID=UPI001B31289A|nr:chromate transporter [Naasia sp. SYSU D00948]